MKHVSTALAAFALMAMVATLARADIGFEVETGAIMLPDFKAAKTRLHVPQPPAWPRPQGKPWWTLQTDERNKMEAQKCTHTDEQADIEFVTDPFPHTSDGVKRLCGAVGGLYKTMRQIEIGTSDSAFDSKSKKFCKDTVKDEMDLATRKMKRTTTQAKKNKYNSFSFVKDNGAASEVTLFRDAGSGGALVQEPLKWLPQITISLPLDRMWLAIKKLTTSAAAARLFRAWDFVTTTVARIEATPQTSALGNKAKAFLLFVTDYLVSGGSHKCNVEYAKLIASNMMRTNLTIVFQQIEDNTRDAWRQTPNTLIDLITALATDVAARQKGGGVTLCKQGQELSFLASDWTPTLREFVTALVPLDGARDMLSPSGAKVAEKAAELQPMGMFMQLYQVLGKASVAVELRRINPVASADEAIPVLMGIAKFVHAVATAEDDAVANVDFAAADPFGAGVAFQGVADACKMATVVAPLRKIVAQTVLNPKNVQLTGAGVCSSMCGLMIGAWKAGAKAKAAGCGKAEWQTKSTQCVALRDAMRVAEVIYNPLQRETHSTAAFKLPNLTKPKFTQGKNIPAFHASEVAAVCEDVCTKFGGEPAAAEAEVVVVEAPQPAHGIGHAQGLLNQALLQVEQLPSPRSEHQISNEMKNKQKQRAINNQ